MNERWDWSGTFSKISTWLGIIAAAGVPGLVAYATLPDRAQALLPDWTLLVLAGMVMLPAMSIGVATAYKQKNLNKVSKVEIVSTTVVKGDVTAGDAARIAEAVAPAKEVTDV